MENNNFEQMVIVVLEEKESFILGFLLSICCTGYDLLKRLQEFR